MKRLKYKEFVPIGEGLSVGEQVNIDHEDCEAGHDSKRRLYIKRCEDGYTIVAYCHHCCKSGSYRDAFHKARQAQKDDKPFIGRNSADDASRIRKNLRADWKDWSPRAIGWVRQYGITEEECSKYGLGYLPDEDRVVIPILVDTKVVGYQLRSLDPKDKPKYKTVCLAKPMLWYSGNIGDKLVITEDVLSAIKCTRAGVSTLAILSSNVSNEVLELISKSGHSDIIVFLDDDNKHVRRNQQKIKERLELFGKARIIKGLGKDPKECSDEELEELFSDK